MSRSGSSVCMLNGRGWREEPSGKCDGVIRLGLPPAGLG